MTPAPGYLLPPGDAYTDDLACALVFYPDKTEYRRALLGSIVYLSNWLAWERDVDKRGKDAARAWKNAVESTMECWNMTCFEELIEDVERIRILLENKKDCCDQNTTYYPTEDPSTEIEPLVGDPPEYYGETAIADWDEWLEHVCWNAHKYVDYLKDTAEQLEDAVSISSIFIGVIGASLALLAFSGLLLAVPYALAAAVVAGIVLLATSTTFQDTSDDFETARDDIVCAIATGASLPDAIEAALSSGTDWDLFYQWIDYGAATAIMYEGGWDDEFLPAELRDDCDTCTQEPHLDGWERWGDTAEIITAFHEPEVLCEYYITNDQEHYITENDCEFDYDGHVRIAGYVSIEGSMIEGSNCTGGMWLKVQLYTHFSTACRANPTGGPGYWVYSNESETEGTKDLRLPFDITTAWGDNLRTIRLRMYLHVFAHQADLTTKLVIQIVEPADPP